MEVKELTEWVFDIYHEWENIYGISGEQSLKDGKKMDEVIERLKRGEKYEKMWKEFKKGYEKYDLSYYDGSDYEVSSVVRRFEQEYFPEG